MMNSVDVIGRLTRDPELRYTSSGHAIAGFGIACERSFTNQQGEKETDFFDVTCWRKLAEVVANNLGKGRLVGVSGRLQQDRWEQDGQKRSKVVIVANEVQFLDWPDDNGSRGSGQRAAPEDDFNPDDVPF